MMLLVEGDGAGFGVPSCATRFPPLRFDLCVLSVWHLTFLGKSCSFFFAAGIRTGCCAVTVPHFLCVFVCVVCAERHRTTKGREEGGTGRGYHVCAISKDKEKTELEKRGNKTQGRSGRHRLFFGQNLKQRQKR